ncbi:hypothetical protein CXR86_15350 [Listeria monocytogenes]|nr:hypothetical protein CXR86_15350 [Listeria monocytogenes]
MAWCSAKQKPKYKNLVEKSRARGFPHKELIFGVPSANGEFVSIRRFPLISPVILYNKECFQNNSKNQLDNSGN